METLQKLTHLLHKFQLPCKGNNGLKMGGKMGGIFQTIKFFISTLRNLRFAFITFRREPITWRVTDGQHLSTNQRRCFKSTGENSNGREFIKESVISYE